jgi:hypothetical protein
MLILGFDHARWALTYRLAQVQFTTRWPCHAVHLLCSHALNSTLCLLLKISCCQYDQFNLRQSDGFHQCIDKMAANVWCLDWKKTTHRWLPIESAISRYVLNLWYSDWMSWVIPHSVGYSAVLQWAGESAYFHTFHIRTRNPQDTYRV